MFSIFITIVKTMTNKELLYMSIILIAISITMIVYNYNSEEEALFIANGIILNIGIWMLTRLI